MRRFTSCKFAVGAATALLPFGVLYATSSTAVSAAPRDAHFHGRQSSEFTVHVILSGTTLSHTFSPNGTGAPTAEPLSDPDDITALGDDVFVGFQNGVSPTGGASSDGNLDSTVVAFRRNGDPVAQWDVVGKTDGVTADPQAGIVIATANEDGNSSLYTIDPSASPADEVTHYAYNEPLPHNGGTDAISIYHGLILISASAPGTVGAPAPDPSYPAVYSVVLDPTTKIATVTPVFYDEASAEVANTNSPSFGQRTTLMLTDPDSNEVVPFGARFGGDFMLTSQGDQEQIFVGDLGRGHQHLSVLSLTQSVDDTAWPSGRGRLYATDSTNDSIDTITGPFAEDQPVVVATPCDANSAASLTVCPDPPAVPANFLATLDPSTGEVSPITLVGAAFIPQGGLLYLPFGGDRSGPGR